MPPLGVLEGTRFQVEIYVVFCFEKSCSFYDGQQFIEIDSELTKILQKLSTYWKIFKHIISSVAVRIPFAAR